MLTKKCILWVVNCGFVSALRAGHIFIKLTNTKRHELDRHEAIQNKKAELSQRWPRNV